MKEALILHVFYKLTNGFYMAVYLGYLPHFSNVALRIDYIGGAYNTHIFLAVVLFQLPNAVRLQHHMIRVGKQMEGQIVFAGKTFMALHAVCTDTNYNSIGKAICHFSKALCFPGATGSIILWIKIEYNIFA